jgi:ABC-type phosphate/phosphonate transport system permease subunit
MRNASGLRPVMRIVVANHRTSYYIIILLVAISTYLMYFNEAEEDFIFKNGGPFSTDFFTDFFEPKSESSNCLPVEKNVLHTKMYSSTSKSPQGKHTFLYLTRKKTLTRTRPHNM